jgi:D-alanine-D-alanine ligase
MKVTEHHTKNNIPVTNTSLSKRLQAMAIAIFCGFDAESYARIDFRSNHSGEIFFLEINCECSIFYPEGSEGSADYILKHEPIGHAGFLQLIIADGIRRHQRRQKPFIVRMASNRSLACFAARDLREGEIAGQPGLFRPSPNFNLISHGADLITIRPVQKGEELSVRAGSDADSLPAR